MTTPSNPSSPAPAPAPRSTPTPTSGRIRGRIRGRWLRRILLGLGVAFILLVLLVLLLPTLVSTGPGTRLVLSFANDAIQGRATVDSLSLGWFSGTSIRGIKLADPSGRPVAEIGSIDAPGVSLWRLVRGNLDMGKITVTDATFTVVEYPDGTLNLMQAVSPRAKPQPQPQPPTTPAKPLDLSGFRAAIQLQNVRVTYTQPGQEPVALSLNASAQATGLHLIELPSLHMELAQGDRKGTLDASATINNLLDDHAGIHLDQVRAEGRLKAAALPLDVADRCLNQQGKLVATLGPVLNMECTGKGGASDGDFTLTVDSETLHVRTQAALRKGVLEVMPDSDLRFTLTPPAFAAWTARQVDAAAAPADLAARPTLLKPVDLHVQFQRVSLPIAGGQFNPAAAALELALTIGDAQVDGGPGVGRMTLSGTTATVSFTGTDRCRLTAAVSSSAAYAPGPDQPARGGQVKFDAAATDLFTPKGTFNRTGLDAKISAHVENWPLTVVDQVLRQKGLVVAALGPTLSADLTAALKPTGDGNAAGDVTLTVHTQQLNGTLAAAVTDAGVKTTNAPDQPQKLTLKVQPELLPVLLRQFAPQATELQKMAMTGPMELTFDLNQLELPFDKPPLAALSLRASVQLPAAKPAAMAGAPGSTPAPLNPGALALTGVPVTERLALDGLTIDLNYDGPKQALAAQVHTKAVLPEGVVPVDLTAEAGGFQDEKQQLKPAACRGKVRIAVHDVPMALVDAANKGQNAAALGDLVRSIAGRSMNLDATADILPSTGALPAVAFNVTAKDAAANAQSLQTTLVGRYENEVLTLDKQGVTILATVRPETLAAAQRAFPALGPALYGLQLQAPVAVQAHLGNLNLPLSPDGWKHARFTAGLDVGKIALTGDPNLAGLEISSVHLDVPECDLGGKISAALDAPINYRGQACTVHAGADLGDVLSRSPRYSLNAKVEKLPLAAADTLGNLDGLLVTVLGNTLDNLSVTVAPDSKDPANLLFTVTAGTERLAVDAAGSFKPSERFALRQDKESFAELTLTPQSLDGLSAWLVKRGGKDPGLKLTDATKYRLALPQVDVALVNRPAMSSGGAGASGGAGGNPGSPAASGGAPAALPLDPAKTKLSVALTSAASTLVLKGNNDQVRLNNLSLTLAAPNLAGPISVKLDCDTQTTLAAAAGQPVVAGAPGSTPAPVNPGANPGAQAGGIHTTITLANLIDPQGRIDPAKATIALEQTTLKGLPVGLIDKLGGFNGLLPAALGPTADATLKAGYGPTGGSCDLTATSTNANVKLSAGWDKDRVLKLRSAPTLELKATPELFTQLAKLNPMLAGIQSAEKPVKLTIKPDTFAVPLGAANSQEMMNNITVDATLEIGKVRMASGPFTQGMVGLLIRFIPNSKVNDTFNATLSPVPVHVARGQMNTTSDVWLTSTDLVVGANGAPKLAAMGLRIDALNLTTKDSTVRVALPGIMLGQLPYMQKAFGADYVYEQAYQGPISQVNPNYRDLVLQLVEVGGKAQAADQADKQLQRINNPLERALLQALAKKASDALTGVIPQLNQQGEIVKRWPNRPTKLPQGVTADSATPAGAPGGQQPKTPPAKTPPPQPLIPLPKLPGF